MKKGRDTHQRKITPRSSDDKFVIGICSGVGKFQLVSVYVVEHLFKKYVFIMFVTNNNIGHAKEHAQYYQDAYDKFIFQAPLY